MPMKDHLRFSWLVFRDSVLSLIADNTLTHAASIAFYTIFSMPAVLIIALAIGTTFYEQDTVKNELINQVSLLIGQKNALEVEAILSNAYVDASGAVARTIGVATLIFSATTVFVSLQTGLNAVWRLRAKPERGFFKFLINRILSMAMVVSIGFILLVSLLVDTLLVIFQDHFNIFFSRIEVDILTIVNSLASLAFIASLFALLFKVLPDARVAWRDVWIGSTITTVLFVVGKFLIGFYLGTSSVTSAYGAAGSLAIILIWVYYSTVIVLFGAQITYVYMARKGREIKPYKNAVHIKVVEIEPRQT